MLGSLKTIMPSTMGPGSAPVVIRPFGFALFSTFNNRGEASKSIQEVDAFTQELEEVVEALADDDLVRGRDLAVSLLLRMQECCGRN